MSDELVISDLSEEIETAPDSSDRQDPDEYFANNAFRIVYQTNNFFLPQLKDIIDKREVLNLRPEYQRRLRWNSLQKSKLIESLLLNIPIPPIFLYENDAARYEVLDGQQRLAAVHEFMSGGFELSGLDVLKPLNGIHYLRCPPRIKRALNRSTVSAIVLLLESEKEKGEKGKSSESLKLTDIRRFIFDRLNTGGTKLNPQEIRNALNPGNFNKLIIDLARESLFTKIFDIPAYTETNPDEYYENPDRQKNNLYATMGDCQLVLRYFALKDERSIRGSMRSMLDKAMERKISDSEYDVLFAEYLGLLQFLFDLFGERPFRLPATETGRIRVSAGLYDASMVAMNKLWELREKIRLDATRVRNNLAEALANPAKLNILTGAGNTAQAVKDRIDLMQSILKPL